jgi:hypothetical protein
LEAQTLLPLVVETLEQHALADSAVERSRFRGEKMLGGGVFFSLFILYQLL